jgi:hypothetical protein
MIRLTHEIHSRTHHSFERSEYAFIYAPGPGVLDDFPYPTLTCVVGSLLIHNLSLADKLLIV